jgi:hypothetical protein
MSTAAILAIVQGVLIYGPSFGRQLHQIFTKEAPTEADWQALFAAGDKSYAELRAEAEARKALKGNP